MEGRRVGGGVDYDEIGDFWEGQGGKRKRKRAFGDGNEGTETPMKGKKARDDVEVVEDGQDAGEPAVVSTSTGQAQDEDEWQDREDYDLAQDDDEVDVGNARRNPGLSAIVEDVEERIGTEAPDGETVDARAVAKEKRKGQARGGERTQYARNY